MTRDEMTTWVRPDVPGAVMWESEYHWIGLGRRSTLHAPDMIEDVVHCLADPNVVHFTVYPIDENGERISKAPSHAE